MNMRSQPASPNIFASSAAAPLTASFSSRGPLLAGGGDLLKPDLMAPGQDIIAGVAPPNNFGQLFASYQGTSMSSPHVAGLAALLKERHPDWSPMAIKSALMTTGVDVLDGGTPPAAENNPVLIFRQGAGHVRPNLADNPGVVFDSNITDWIAFICGTQPGSFCAPNQAIDPSNLNVASIAIGDMAGTQTVTRRITNVTGSTQTFTVTSTGLSGFGVTLPSPIVRSGRRWMVPVEFLPRALGPIYDQRIDLRRQSRLLIVGDLRVPRITARIDATGPPTRATVEIAPPVPVSGCRCFHSFHGSLATVSRDSTSRGLSPRGVTPVTAQMNWPERAL